MSVFLDLLSESILSEEIVVFVLFIPGFWLVSEVSNKKPGWLRRSWGAYFALFIPYALMMALGVTGNASVAQINSALAGGVFGPLFGSLMVMARAMHPRETKAPEENQPQAR